MYVRSGDKYLYNNRLLLRPQLDRMWVYIFNGHFNWWSCYDWYIHACCEYASLVSVDMHDSVMRYIRILYVHIYMHIYIYIYIYMHIYIYIYIYMHIYMYVQYTYIPHHWIMHIHTDQWSIFATCMYIPVVAWPSIKVAIEDVHSHPVQLWPE